MEGEGVKILIRGPGGKERGGGWERERILAN